MPARFLEEFMAMYGGGAVSFVTAHEIGHAYQLQNGWYKAPPYHEWQADCIAGAAMRNSLFSSRERKQAENAAYAIGGGSTHGSGFGRRQSFLKGLNGGVAACR